MSEGAVVGPLTEPTGSTMEDGVTPGALEVMDTTLHTNTTVGTDGVGTASPAISMAAEGVLAYLPKNPANFVHQNLET